MSQIIYTPGYKGEQREVTEDEQVNPNDLLHAKSIADTLERHYPGHAWMVNVNGKQGVATIRSQMLSGQWGYVLRMPEVFSATDLDQRVMKAGGEILERFGTARRRFDGEKWAELPTSAAGVPLFQKD